MNDDLDKLVEDRIKQKEAEEKAKAEYARAKAEAETKEISLIAQDPNKAVKVKLSEKLVKSLDNAVVDEKVEHTAQKIVDKGLEEQENLADADVIASEDATLVADFQKNKDEYLYHGINHKVDKKWKRKLLHTINDIWFVIWAIVSCFTIVPISTFLSRIGALKGFMKGVAMVLGIVMLLACLGGLTYGCLKWTGVV